MCFEFLSLDLSELMLFFSSFESMPARRLMSTIFHREIAEPKAQVASERKQTLHPLLQERPRTSTKEAFHQVDDLINVQHLLLRPYTSHIDKPYNIYGPPRGNVKLVELFNGLAMLLKRTRKDNVATSARIAAGPRRTLCYEFLWTRKGVPKSTPADADYVSAIIERLGYDDSHRRILPLVARYCKNAIVFHLNKLANALGVNAKKSKAHVEDILGIWKQYRYAEFSKNFDWQIEPADDPENQIWRWIDNFVRRCAKSESEMTEEGIVFAI